MKWHVRIWCAGLALWFAAPGLAGQSADDLAILEAVLRHEIGVFLKPGTGAAGAPVPSAFCIRIRATARAEPADPGGALLARFSGHRPPVKPGSACTVKDWKVYDSASGQAAAILDYGPIVRRPNASEAEVSGAPYVGGQVAREYLYRLRLKGRTWTVHDVELKLVS